eukprot:TRINITY_DN3383_c0_g1_i1.p1 TRINITY_DN3383_c0_g1~~TRINITY_DN3383_c0_g1_i1.p1  ORF type:complete len:115 (+),score=17.21 TRINITY_DN3383_c0_g1_i1:32-346(+)
MAFLFRGLFSSGLLQTAEVSRSLISNQVRGLKFLKFPRKRCSSCYFVFSENRKEVYCDKHPRHRQSTPVLRKKLTYIMTHATQGRNSFPGNTGMNTQSRLRLDF